MSREESILRAALRSGLTFELPPTSLFKFASLLTEHDTALLRQALEALKQVKPLYDKHDIIAALKERLGEKK